MAKRKIDILKRLGLIIGPCTDYDFTQIDKTREYWQELYLKRVETRKKILSTAGIETTLENIHNKGLKYGLDRHGNEILLSTYDPIEEEIKQILTKKK